MSKAKPDQAALLDDIYAYQRLVYDWTRKFFLFGRDTLIKEMRLEPGDHVIEVGCGTARNLIALAKKHPDVNFYGVDASKEMLKTAKNSVEKAGLSKQISLSFGYAESYDPAELFELKESVDAIFFSYSLSMMPTWDKAIGHNLELLCPTRTLYIVDFWDQRGFPKFFRYILTKWLSLFHVKHEPKLLEALNKAEQDGHGKLSLQPFIGHYAYLAKLKKSNGIDELGRIAV